MTAKQKPFFVMPCSNVGKTRRYTTFDVMERTVDGFVFISEHRKRGVAARKVRKLNRI